MACKIQSWNLQYDNFVALLNLIFSKLKYETYKEFSFVLNHSYIFLNDFFVCNSLDLRKNHIGECFVFYKRVLFFTLNECCQTTYVVAHLATLIKSQLNFDIKMLVCLKINSTKLISLRCSLDLKRMHI